MQGKATDAKLLDVGVAAWGRQSALMLTAKVIWFNECPNSSRTHALMRVTNQTVACAGRFHVFVAHGLAALYEADGVTRQTCERPEIKVSSIGPLARKAKPRNYTNKNSFQFSVFSFQPS